MDIKNAKFLEYIKNSEKIAIGAHINPDSDATSSSLAMAMTVAKLGKVPTVFLYKYNKNFSYLKGTEYIYKEEDLQKEFDLFITLDCGDKNRLGVSLETFEKAKLKVNIDHHLSNDKYGDLQFININASSTCENLYEIIKDFDIIDKNIAECLYTGIVGDTCAFKYKSASSRTHEIAGKLLEYGIDSSEIHTAVLHSHSLAKIRLFQKFLENIKIYEKVMYSSISFDDLTSVGAEYSDLDGFAEYLLNTDDIEVSFIVYQKSDGSIKVSFRSKKLDVNAIANKFGGGGHKLAAGASLDGTIEVVINTILKELKVSI